MEHLREFWRGMGLLIGFTTGNIFMRLATVLFLIAMLASFATEQLGNDCRVAVCRWFGLRLVLVSWTAAIMLQLAPRRWQRRHIPEAFVVLVVPLLAIVAMLVGSFSESILQGLVTVLLVFPLMAQIAVGMAETARRWRRIFRPRAVRRRPRRSS